MIQYIEQLELALNRTGRASDFCSTATLQQHLDLLTHLLQFSELLLYINGPDGIGKSTLVQQFINKAHENWRICLLNAQDIQTPQRLIQQLINQFDLPSLSEHESPEIHLIQYFNKLQQAAQLPVIIIDDAEQLDLDTLKTLFHLAPNLADTLSSVRILLIGNQKLKKKLAKSGLYDDNNPPLHEVELTTLDEKQTADYLKQRLNSANLTGELPFSDREIHLIHQESEGIPQQIHQRAIHHYHQKMLSSVKLKNEEEPTKFPITKKYILITFAIALLSPLLWWQDSINQFFSGTDNTTPKHQQQREIALPRADRSILEITQMAPPAKKQVRTDPAPQSTASKKPRSSHHDTPIEHDKTDLNQLVEPKKAIIIEPPVTITPVQPLASSIAEQVKPVPTPETEKTVTDDHPSNEVVLQPPEWLLQQNPTHYTLQLLSARKQSSILDFSKKYNDIQYLAHFNHTVKGRQWHVITAGIYPSRVAAKKAILTLPKALQANQPWPRRLSAIQQAIHKNSPESIPSD
ncbi:MAG: AAA family ATPase [Gammaproteobacteria bacterium]|nr:AAA family ATPase [Gammaproteobacteria bacterium]